MDNEQIERAASRRSVQIYLPISFGVALLFAAIASLSGKYLPVAVLGGAIWVGFLSLIVSMPLVISRMKKQLK